MMRLVFVLLLLLSLAPGSARAFDYLEHSHRPRLPICLETLKRERSALITVPCSYHVTWPWAWSALQPVSTKQRRL